MKTFREYAEEKLNEAAKIKVKKEKILDLDNKRYGGDVPLCKKVHKDIKNICELLEKGYFLLENDKSFKKDVIISPEDYAKIENSDKTLTNEFATVKIGRSEYRLTKLDHVSNKANLVTIENAEPLYSIKKNPIEYNYLNSDLVYGFFTAVTKNIADSHAKDGYLSAYFNSKGTVLMMLSANKNSIDKNKKYVAWVQQHSAQKWKFFKEGELIWDTVSVNKLFPGSYKKSTIDKSHVFILK